MYNTVFRLEFLNIFKFNLIGLKLEINIYFCTSVNESIFF
jgi:hypothetical protein